MPAAVAADLQTVLREALTNVARHAKARRVDVTVNVELGGDIVLRVEDDGIGRTDAALPEPGGGLGLRNIARRAERYGGRLEMSGSANGGFVLEWRVPQSPAQA